MATPDHVKRRSMDAIAHRETGVQMRAFRGAPKAQVLQLPPALPERRSVVPQNVKRMAMNAINNVETVAQVGTLKATGGVAVYVARIREVDRENQRTRPPERKENPPYRKSEGFLKE